MSLSHLSCSLALVLIVGTVAARGEGLADYVARDDGSFHYEVAAERTVDSCQVLAVRLTSQTWQDITWWHWLYVIVPPEIKHEDGAILFISGGSNRDTNPFRGADEAQRFVSLARRTGAVFALLRQVPNQPLFGDRHEDDIIAYTFDKYLNNEGDDWPLLLPMTKSAVRAMDAVQSLATEKLDQRIERFVVSGGSKRGWTTWLTAAVDSRVAGIAPMVIDVLDIPSQMKRQLRTYGSYSERITPYTRLEIQERMDTPRGRQLVDLVDPFSYRESYTMPKLVVLGTNDPYWTVDASSVYFPELPEPKHLFYLPNAGHGLGEGIVPTVITFFRAALADRRLPHVDAEYDAQQGELRVSWGHREGRAVLWHAHSHDRDFREAAWSSTPLTNSSQQCVAPLDAPEEGWTAYYVEVRFESPGGSTFALCTPMTVLPGEFPYEVTEEADGSLAIEAR